jgi:A/G-specific adenine glycosylase
MRRNVEKDIPRLLLEWYRTNKRDLPWRRTKDPYRIWVAEIMLQQTRVDTVIPYYERFLKRFPDVRALARARMDDVLKQWENLGYYSRARHLHEAARVVEERFGGSVPAAMEDLRALPGIGAYTAGAILSIAFGRRFAAVDGNVIRVIMRLFAIEEPPAQRDTKKTIEGIARRLVPAKEPGHYNQALMDLGSGICTPREPVCPECPLCILCRAQKKGLQASIPAKKKQAVIPRREAAAAVIREPEGRILLVKRPHRGLLSGLWRFPEAEGKSARALRGALKKDLGLTVDVGKEIFSIDHVYSHFAVRVHVFDCRLVEKARPAGLPDGRWVSPDGAARLALSKLERMILQRLESP